MKEKKIKIICTLGPSSLNKDFLKFAKNKVNLLRLNMFHVKINLQDHLQLKSFHK